MVASLLHAPLCTFQYSHPSGLRDYIHTFFSPSCLIGALLHASLCTDILSCRKTSSSKAVPYTRPASIRRVALQLERRPYHIFADTNACATKKIANTLSRSKKLRHARTLNASYSIHEGWPRSVLLPLLPETRWTSPKHVLLIYTGHDELVD